MDALYQLKNICKSFKMTTGTVQVLKDLNMVIPHGKFVALVGKSGCGKTTLLHLLGGLDRPTSGDILLDGIAISSLSSSKLTQIRLKRIGFVFQSYHLFPELSSLENAVLPALHWGENREAAAKRAENWLRKFGLGERLTHRPMELSGGEQQRVAIARALINNPDIILADEPTGNLDKNAANDIMKIIKGVCQAEQKTLIMVTHDTEIAKSADLTIGL